MRVVLSRILNWRPLPLVFAVLLGLCHSSGLWRLSYLTRFDQTLADTRLRVLAPGGSDPRIVIIDIDERSLAEVGRWPWGRDRMAALTHELFGRQGAAAVGFDLVFAEPDNSSGLPMLERLAQTDPVLAARMPMLRQSLDHDAALARALQSHNAVLGFYLSNAGGGVESGQLPAPVLPELDALPERLGITRWSGFSASLPSLAAAAPQAGFFNFLPDDDGLVRRVPLLAEHAGKRYPALSLAMLQAYTGRPDVRVQVARPAQVGGHAALTALVLGQGSQTLRIPVDPQAAVRVPFRGAGGRAGGSFEYLGAADVLAGRVPAAHLAGRLVLVGSSAPGMFDVQSTPVGLAFPGVEVHAHLLSGLLDGRVPNEPDWAPGFEIALLLACGAVLSVMLRRVRAGASMLLMLALVVAVLGLNIWLYVRHAWVLPLAATLFLLAVVHVTHMSLGYVREGRRRRLLTQMFGVYVPPERVAQMARDPRRFDMHAENRSLSIMFCDMRNFTAAAEALSPEALRELINRFFSEMTAEIRNQRGTLDKYIGDALMAFWGAPIDDPEHARHAVQAGLGMLARMAPLNRSLVSAGLPPISVGLGINTGWVCVGDMGSNVRRSYTVMGDPVNVASRIESLTRHYGVDLLVGEDTRLAAGDMLGEGGWVWVEVDRVRVKGKTQGVSLFTPVATVVADNITFKEEVRLWHLALTACRQQQWSLSETLLQSLMALADPASLTPHPVQGLGQQLAQRIAQHRLSPPPPDWDGTHAFDKK